MTLSIVTTVEGDDIEAGIRRQTRTTITTAGVAIADDGVRALKGPRSRWPVRTGKSKRAWKGRYVPGAEAIVFTNPTEYWPFVEERHGKNRFGGAGISRFGASRSSLSAAGKGPAEQTIDRALPSALRKAERRARAIS